MVYFKQCFLLLVTAGVAFASVVVATADTREHSLSSDRSSPVDEGRAGKGEMHSPSSESSPSESVPHNTHDSFDPSTAHAVSSRGEGLHTEIDQQLSDFLSTHGYHLSSDDAHASPSLCLLTTPGCTAYESEEKKEIEGEVRRILSANACVGEEGCTSEQEIAGLVRGGNDAYGRSGDGRRHEKRSDSGQIGVHADLFTQTQILATARRISESAVHLATSDQGYCDLHSTTCKQDPCPLSTAGCIPFSMEEKQQYEQELYVMLAKVLSTGRCESGRGCGEEGEECELWNDHGERREGCRVPTDKEVEAGVRSAMDGRFGSSPNSADHKDLVKRILSFDEPDPDHQPHLDDSTLHRSSPRIVIPASSLSNPDLPAPSRHELESFMSLCSQLSSNPAELEQIATAAGITDPRDIESLRLRFATLAENKEQAAEVLKQAKMAQMLGESKVEHGTDEGGDGEKDEKKE